MVEKKLFINEMNINEYFNKQSNIITNGDVIGNISPISPSIPFSTDTRLKSSLRDRIINNDVIGK